MSNDDTAYILHAHFLTTLIEQSCRSNFVWNCADPLATYGIIRASNEVMVGILTPSVW